MKVGKHFAGRQIIGARKAQEDSYAFSIIADQSISRATAAASILVRRSSPNLSFSVCRSRFIRVRWRAGLSISF